MILWWPFRKDMWFAWVWKEKNLGYDFFLHHCSVLCIGCIYTSIYILFFAIERCFRSPGHPSGASCSWGIWDDPSYDGSEWLYWAWWTWSYMSKLSSFPSLDGRVDSNLAKSEISVVGFATARKISCQKFHSGLPPNEASSSSAFETSLSLSSSFLNFPQLAIAINV